MAPIRPSSQSKRLANPLAVKQHTSYPAKSTNSAFTSTKKDKQLMKHSIFMSKVQDSGVKKLKRRRPGKKLVTNLESLEDALQDAENEVASQQAPQVKTIKEGRGQAKRKEKIVKEERERFGKNMAILSTSTQAKSTNGAGDGGGGRFAALRAHIQASMPTTTTTTTTTGAG